MPIGGAGIGGAGINEGAGVGTAGIVKTFGGGGYTGPLDLVSGADWVFAVSTARAMSASMVSQNAYTVQKLDGDQEPTQTFAYGSDGYIDAAAITSFLGEDDGCITQLNDNSGNGKDWMASDQASIWGASIQNGKPGITAADAAAMSTADSIPFDPAECTMFVVCKGPLAIKRTGGGDGYIDFELINPSYVDMSDGTAQAGGEIDQPSDAVHLHAVKWKTGERSWEIDGVAQTFNAVYDSDVMTAFSVTSLLLEILEAGPQILEVAIANGYLSDADMNTVSADMRAFWNTPALQ